MTDLLTRTADFTPERATALARIDDFVGRAGSHYANTRNHDFGPQDRSNVSALSPFIRHRLITEEEVCARVLERYALSSAEKFIQEVLWRTYWKGWLEMRPSVFHDYEASRDRALDRIDANSGLRTAYDEAIGGRTGIDCFEAWARELVETGYLHNHARMWFASIWIFTLNLPWALGADFFYRHLMDGDPASNTLGWRWVAGLQTRGKNYVARASNIHKFTDGRFNPSGLNEHAGPLEDDDASPKAMPPRAADPMPATGPVFILVTDDDCRFEEHDLTRHEIAGVATWSTIKARSPLDIGEKAEHFSQAALHDAGERITGATGGDIIAIDGPGETTALMDAIRASGARSVITPFATAGTNQPLMSGLRRMLGSHHIALHEIRRDWDSRAWPYATKGFFPFKEKIPQLLHDAGLDIGAKRGQRS